MSEKQWYEDLPREEIEGKHVRAVLSSGTVIEGRLEYWDSQLITIGSLSEGNYVLRGSEKDIWKLTKDVDDLDLVWDERDWGWVGLDDIEAIDALVVAGRLYELVSHKPDCDLWQVRIPGEKHTASVSTAMISCALRRKVNVPAKPGFYKDTLGEFWARSAKSTDDGTWRSVEPDALDQPAKSDKYMANLMPLTPVHFVDGRAPEPGDELASVMRVTSKGVTFTTEAA